MAISFKADCELLSPAGDFTTALAAFEAGANAVYCGLADFSARAFAKNFSFEELELLIRYAHARQGKVYVTFNTLLDEEQLEDAIETLAKLEELRPDGVIVQDLGVARLARKHFAGLVLHASTQLVAHNLEGVLALKELGFKRVVLARELSLEEIRSIARRCGEMELEVFIHGALCYSISGLCLYGAMEKGRSGNRGRCPYCCRQAVGGKYPFSMKDLRLGEDVRKLVEAGVASLKIEGRMKTPLYVASVTKYYRDILDGVKRGDSVSEADLESVFSRRTTELYFNGKSQASVIDAESLGHRGTLVGTVKKVTKDREGRSWLRFHTTRALERHDGLQFEAMTDEGRHFGFGIAEMRPAISRRNVFEIAAGEDVEVLLPDEHPELRGGDAIYCSMSNAVKRRFSIPSFRPSDYEGDIALDLEVELTAQAIKVRVIGGDERVSRCEVSIEGELAAAKNPERTLESVKKAFGKLGGTAYRLGAVRMVDEERRFAPMSLLNDLRRELVERLDDERAKARAAKLEAAVAELDETITVEGEVPAKVLKIRVGQTIPTGEWDELVVAVDATTTSEALPHDARLALPVYTSEPEFNQLRVMVKRCLREGWTKWEAADLATLRMLRHLGVEDVTADWSLYAFNSQALATLVELGARRFVASPENGRDNLAYLAESGYPVELLVQQSTPLFISLTQPVREGLKETDAITVFEWGSLWVTTKRVPRTFIVPSGANTRVDLSWDPEDGE